MKKYQGEDIYFSLNFTNSSNLNITSFDDLENVIPYYLDLKSFRSISDEVAERFSVHHESPQILLIRQGECIYDASHFDITIAELKETLVFHA